MSETVEKEPRWQDNEKEIKADALALYIRGHGFRKARRILMKKFSLVPASDTIRGWSRKYSKDVKEALAKDGEMAILEALEVEGDHVEDISDDILSYAVPSVMKDLKDGKFDDLPLKEKLDIVTKELTAKSRRNETKIMRLDPAVNSQAPPFIVALLRQSTKSFGEPDGSTGTGIIDAQVTDVQQVASVPAAGLSAPAGKAD